MPVIEQEAILQGNEQEEEVPFDPLLAEIESLTLTIIADEKTWLQVKIDGGEERKIFLAAGKIINWEAEEKFVLTNGNMAGTRVRLNGEDLILPSSNKNVLWKYVITRDWAP